MIQTETSKPFDMKKLSKKGTDTLANNKLQKKQLEMVSQEIEGT
jgi:hypothetical protein